MYSTCVILCIQHFYRLYIIHFCSISSSYHDLMPQFLRCIKILCTLYPFYRQAQPRTITTTSTLPAGPVSPNRRADSIGTHLDRPSPRARSFLNSWTGHRRTSSTPDDFNDKTGIDLFEDPFDQLEMIWTSLESWFDLLLKEIFKLSDQKLQEHKIDKTTDTSQLAAAIILSAPPKRREVFLKPSISFDSPQQVADKSNWRRSWHADRYVRVTPLSEEQDTSTSSLPSYNRSKSTEMSTTNNTDISKNLLLLLLLLLLFFSLQVDVNLANGSGCHNDEGADPSRSLEDQWNPDIVDAYADRLGAITHAFSLCCNVLNKSNRK